MPPAKKEPSPPNSAMMSFEQQNPMVQMPQVVEQTGVQYQQYQQPTWQQPIQQTRDLPAQVNRYCMNAVFNVFFLKVTVFLIAMLRRQGEVSANIGIMQQQQEEAERLVEQQRMAAMTAVAMSSDIVTPTPGGPGMQSGALMSAVPVPELQETPTPAQMEFSMHSGDPELERTTTFA